LLIFISLFHVLGRDPSLMKSLLTEKGPSLERNLWIRDVTAATVCRSRAPVRSRWNPKQGLDHVPNPG